jgi:hypothetical protein
VTVASPADLRSRLYEAYASRHAGCGGDEAAALVYRRDIRPLLPLLAAGPVVDLGCGRGELATDLLEHLTKPEVLQTFDDAAAALVPGGVFVGRVPNAVSPLGGHIRNGDFTHQTLFTARSIRQLAAAAGFDMVLARSPPPVARGLASAARVTIWQLVSACYRIALAAETGMLRDHIVTQNLTFVARKGAVTVQPAAS